MVIGKGLIAKKFSAYTDNGNVLIFASGVSNSKNTNPAEYEREKNLLLQTLRENKEKTVVYFSTCSIYDPAESKSQYVAHKLELETIIKTHADSYRIFRVSNVVGQSVNPNTVLNYFYFHINNHINFDLWSGAYRNLIDIDDMYSIAHTILSRSLFKNQVVNIANTENYSAGDIVTALEKQMNQKANYIKIEKGANFTIDTSAIAPIIKEAGIIFEYPAYLHHLIKKYYPVNDL